MAENDLDDEATPDSQTVVALYDFDPTSIDWPFRRQRPLALQTGLVVKIIHDDGSEWALGHPEGMPDQRGYFPKNYTVLIREYEALVADYERKEGLEAPKRDDVLEDEGERLGAPEPTPLPTQLPDAGSVPTYARSVADEDEKRLHEIQVPGVISYPVLDPDPPVATTYESNKARLLIEPPLVPRLRPIEPAPPSDPIDRAMLEVLKEHASMHSDSRALPGGKITDSRASTPATLTMTRPDRDFVRRHLPVELKNSRLQKLSDVREYIFRRINQLREAKPPYTRDLRARSTSCRIAAGIDPLIMRRALYEAGQQHAHWKQMFRPAFNDIVNEAYKMGCNACILSNGYLSGQEYKETYQRAHVHHVGGTVWFDLQRRKNHLFYMRMENMDVMMCHPDAWGFPDTFQIVSHQPGDIYNPMHGWLHQVSIDTDTEMEDVQFRYTTRLRTFPELAFANLALGKAPKWVEPYSTLLGEASLEDDKPVEDGGGAEKPLAYGFAVEAGNDSEDVFVKIDELRLARERTVGPDILDQRCESYTIKGLIAMRLFYRSKGKPDLSKQTLITPKIVKDMAAQLGMFGVFQHYWYCLFALRYPLAPEWEVIVKNDTRWYIHLPSDRTQPFHPLIKAFRTHLLDFIASEFLWDFRGFVHMKCSQCGVPDSVVWCMQCTDYFCAKCFHATHASARGKKHQLLPLPGCRYLSKQEVIRMDPFLPLLNIGFSNRRRFLAMDNQSDKMGARHGDSWLYFHADTLTAALAQCPKDHWHVKRFNPPRLAPGQTGYYYNFEYDILADDESHIMTISRQQRAVATLQKHFRGCLTRKMLRRRTEAAVVIQKTRVMSLVLREYGNTGRNASILKRFYLKFKARMDRNVLEYRIAQAQGVFRGIQTRKLFRMRVLAFSRFQSAFRGRLCRRQLCVNGHSTLNVRCIRHGLQRPAAEAVTIKPLNQSGRKHWAVLTIQRYYRGYLHGRRVMARRHKNASKIQAMWKGIAYRHDLQRWTTSAKRIQARWRGIMGRQMLRRMHSSAAKLGANWRRVLCQMHVKQILFIKQQEHLEKRKDVLREKLCVAAAEILQRGWRRYRDYQNFLFMKKEKGNADKRTQTLIVAMYAAAGSLRHHVHPWWRHLPVEIQEVLEQVKNPLQRTIAGTPLRGKMANEEIGRRGLRVAHVDNLTYKQVGKDPDLASHMFLSIARQLLSLVPPELFSGTIKWACHSISHNAVALSKKGIVPQTVIEVGKEMPPHEGDMLATLWDDARFMRGRIESFIKTPDVSLPASILHALPSHHRQVYLTANVLVTMRQALDEPTLSVEDHLGFHGLDIAGGAQLMEVLGSELDHPLPLDWLKYYGTVAALAAQAAEHIYALQPARPKGHGNPTLKKKPTAKAKSEPKQATGVAKTSELTDKIKSERRKHRPGDAGRAVSVKHEQDDTGGVAWDELGHLAHFNRNAVCRVIQQIGFLMRDQEPIINAVLASEGCNQKDSQGVRTSRYIALTSKLFDMTDQAKHDHCSFVLAVVVFHMVIRGLMMRVMCHRAAITLQKRYRYLKNAGKKFSQLAPAVNIQRFWRGLRAALYTMRKVQAAKLIARNYQIRQRKRRAALFLSSVLTIQRYWRGAMSRMWIRHCHDAAIFIQKSVRRLLIRVMLDKSGRDIVRKHQKEMNSLLRKRDSMAESEHIARVSALIGKVTVQFDKQRNRSVDMRRALSFNLRSKHKRQEDREAMMRNVGRIQPERISIFEPMVFAQARLSPSKLRPRYGAQKSRILDLVNCAKVVLDQTLSPDADSAAWAMASWTCFRNNAHTGTACKAANPGGMVYCKECKLKRHGLLHAAAVRGHAAMAVRRSVKSAKMSDAKQPLSNSKLCSRWSKRVFEVCFQDGHRRLAR